MEKHILDLFAQLKNWVIDNQYIAGGIAIIYLFFLFRRTKKTLVVTFFGSILLIFGTWFWGMNKHKDENKNWKRYNKDREKVLKDIAN